MKRILFKIYLLTFCCIIETNLQSAAIISQKPIPLNILLNRDVDAAKKAIEQGYSVNGKYTEERWFCVNESPLMAAVSFQHLNMINLLLSNGANIDELSPNPDFGSPLIYASHHSLIEIIESLIKNKASINFQDSKGNNSLISNLTGVCLNKDVIWLLLNAGADYNQKNVKGESFKTLAYELKFLWAPLERRRKEIIKVFEEFVELKKNELIESVQSNAIQRVLEILRTYPSVIDDPNELVDIALTKSILFDRSKIIKEIFEDEHIIENPNLFVQAQTIQAIKKYLEGKIAQFHLNRFAKLPEE